MSRSRRARRSRRMRSPPVSGSLTGIAPAATVRADAVRPVRCWPGRTCAARRIRSRCSSSSTLASRARRCRAAGNSMTRKSGRSPPMSNRSERSSPSRCRAIRIAARRCTRLRAARPATGSTAPAARRALNQRCGRSAQLGHIRESLTAPAASFPEGFLVVAAVLADGSKVEASESGGPFLHSDPPGRRRSDLAGQGEPCRACTKERGVRHARL